MGSNSGNSTGRHTTEQMLDRLDACVYVTDLESDEIVFINEKMRQEFGIEDGATGQKCWRLLQDGFTGRCEFCPKYKLAKDADAHVVWEEHNTATQRYYKNTDCIIEWTDGRKVHMQHSVDISEMKWAAAALDRRLAQQRLMSSIAQRFAGAGDFESLTREALEEIGTFMGADIAYILQDVPAERSFLCTSGWSREETTIEKGSKISYVNQMQLYNSLLAADEAVTNQVAELRVSDFLEGSKLEFVYQITVPLFAEDTFWGCLGIASRRRDAWDEGASHLAKLLGGVFSVALERRETELKLYAAEETLQSVIDNVSLGIFWKDLDSVFLGGNIAFANMLEITREELIGKNDTDFSVIWGGGGIRGEDLALIQTGIPIDVEKRATLANGKERWVHVIKTLVKGEDGAPLSIVGIWEDITERKENELHLLRMSLVLENATQFISYSDRDGRFDYINQFASEITGYSHDELMAGGSQLIHDDAGNQRVRDEIMPRIYADGKYQFELPIVRKDGEVRHMSFSGFLIGEDSPGCAVIAADITDRKNLERDLLHEKETAERASRAKTEFLSRMSHEIRTPMNAIIGMTDIARSSDDTAKMHKCLEKIDSASKHLLNIINDILDMAKIEAQRLEITEQEFNLERMVSDAMGVIAFLGEEKRQTVMVKLDRRLPKYITSDETRLKQVITNLLSNAVKFTDEGGEIHLSVKLLRREGPQVKLLVEVVDSGIGMNEAQIKKLFTAFEQGDGSITRKYGGTGLGLAICKQLVALMGGEIWVTSQPGTGSTFSFTIQTTTTDADEPAGLFKEDGEAQARVLAIDDSPEIRDYFTYVLDDYGIQCDLAADGTEALALVRAMNAKGERYDVIFVDWEMPGMNGVETARKIKEIVGDNTIIIMISVFQWDAIERDARAAGIQQFIPKPLFPSMLLEAIHHSRGGGAQIPPGGYHGARNSFNGYHVLLAEDVEVNREIVAAMLEETGIELDFAETGTRAVELFRKDPERYDLIFMDIHMPDMGGHEATRQIRAMTINRAATIPIIAMTADAFREDVEKCKRSGMNGHLAKPISRDNLLSALSQNLPDGPRFASAAVQESIQEENFMDIINAEEGIGRVLGNKKLYLKLLSGCRVRELTDRLTAAVNEQDNERGRQIAHELKGVAANLSLTALTQSASEIEARLKAETSAVDLLASFAEAADATIRAIAALCSKEA